MSVFIRFPGRAEVLQANFRGRIPSFAVLARAQPLAARAPAPHVAAAVQRHRSSSPAAPPLPPGALQLRSAPVPRGVVQRSGADFALQAPAHLDLSSQVPGQPLPSGVRERAESFFSTDFSDVRIHVGPQAGLIGALAFTRGSDLYFAPGQYDPHTPHGLRLLGHELTHVLQQRTGRVRNPFGSGIAVVQDAGLEAEAERMGLRLASSPARASRPLQPRLSSSPAVRRSARPGGGFVIQPLFALLKGTDILLNLKKIDSDMSQSTYIDTDSGKKYRLTNQNALSASRQKSYSVVELVQDMEIEIDDSSSDASSDGWDKESLNSDDERDIFTRKSNQPKLYEQQRSLWDELDLKFNSSKGLSKAVEMVAFGGKGQYSANTHCIFVDKAGERHMIQATTANAMKAMAKRFETDVPYPAVSNEYKGQHVHTEMYLLYKLTGGDAGKIQNILDGCKLYVDKPVCKKCYPYVKLASPRKVKDGTDFYKEPNHAGRGDFPTSTNPFDL